MRFGMLRVTYALGDLCALSFPAVVREPIVREADDSHGVGAFVA